MEDYQKVVMELTNNDLFASNSIITAYIDFSVYTDLKHKQWKPFCEFMYSHYEKDKFNSYSDLNRYVIERHPDMISTFFEVVEESSQSMNKRLDELIYLAKQDIRHRNPELKEVTRTTARENKMMSIIREDTEIHKIFYDSVLKEFPNIYSHIPRQEVYEHIKSLYQKEYAILMAKYEVINYLTDEIKLKDKEQIKKVSEAYKQLGKIEEKYKVFDSKVIDTLVTYDFENVSSLKMAKDYIQELKDESKQVESELPMYTYRQVRDNMKQLPTPTKQSMEVFNTILNYVNKNLNKSETSKNTKSELEIIMYNINQQIIVLQSEGVSYYINPYFMISDLNRKIWVDKLKLFKFNTRAITLDSDTYNKKHLKYIYTLLNENKIKNNEIKPLKQQDIKRLERLKEFSNSTTLEKFGIYSVKTIFNNSGNSSTLQIIFKDKERNIHKLELSPVYSKLNGKPFHQLKTGESNFNSFILCLNTIKNNLTKETYMDISKIVSLSFDLRRKI